ncbi:uncharacterized protein LOC34618372 [Cyclospora cayetanensis]|uniref:Uncharacterized protein LOC34618372 n=1 Tax=Cyclospora cayetanensis TaxID=88456 RepID=A0A6P6RQK1_9EIME|nr:uncharacterized protein LOC34618372 [Cyclospora cayetanensis]
MAEVLCTWQSDGRGAPSSPEHGFPAPCLLVHKSTEFQFRLAPNCCTLSQRRRCFAAPTLDALGLACGSHECYNSIDVALGGAVQPFPVDRKQAGMMHMDGIVMPRGVGAQGAIPWEGNAPAPYFDLPSQHSSFPSHPGRYFLPPAPFPTKRSNAPLHPMAACLPWLLAAITTAAEYAPPLLSPLPVLGAGRATTEDPMTQFFIIRSSTEHNVEVSMRRGVWATIPRNEARLAQAVQEARHVILFFRVQSSQCWAGYALMKNAPGEGSYPSSVFSGRSGRPFVGLTFDIQWIRQVPLSIEKTRNLLNRFNNGESVNRAMDGQPVDPEAGKALAFLFDEMAANTRLPSYAPAYQTARRVAACVGFCAVASIVAGGDGHRALSNNPAMRVFPVDLTEMTYEDYIDTYEASQALWNRVFEKHGYVLDSAAAAAAAAIAAGEPGVAASFGGPPPKTKGLMRPFATASESVAGAACAGAATAGPGASLTSRCFSCSCCAAADCGKNASSAVKGFVATQRESQQEPRSPTDAAKRGRLITHPSEDTSLPAVYMPPRHISPRVAWH